MNYLVDTHCHLNHLDYQLDLPDVLKRAQEAMVTKVVCAGYDLDSSVRAQHLAQEISMMHAAVGVHPHEAASFTPEMEEQLRQMASDRTHVVAIGETGLDYYRDLSPRDAQHDVFRRHIRMAHELELPLIVHSRDAQADVLAILTEEGLPAKGAVMHCFPADSDFAHRSIEMGCYLGVAGSITFKNAVPLQEIVRDLPLDRLLLETDCPYLTPHPHRGHRNEPSYIPLIAAKIAEIQAVEIGDVITATTSNAQTLFGL
jgi:TatD DNase family protein